MDRRSFVKATSALSVTAALPAFAQTPTVRAFSPKAGDWRSFEVAVSYTHLDVYKRQVP